MEKVYENKKTIHEPTNQAPSNHRDHHNASWGAASACARGPEGRTSGWRDGATVEDAPEGTGTTAVSDASPVVVLAASRVVAVSQRCCRTRLAAAPTEEELHTRAGRLATPRSETSGGRVAATGCSPGQPTYLGAVRCKLRMIYVNVSS
jgi:hypothetical protein